MLNKGYMIKIISTSPKSTVNIQLCLQTYQFRSNKLSKKHFEGVNIYIFKVLMKIITKFARLGSSF